MRRAKTDALNSTTIQFKAERLAGSNLYQTRTARLACIVGFKTGVAYAIRMIESGKAAVTIREGKK